MKILIVDNLVLFREGLSSILSRVEGFSIVGEAKKGKEALEQVKKLEPDLVLIDYFLPDIEGSEAIKQMLLIDPDIKCVVLTEEESTDTLIESIRAGAIGYILKDTPASRLITTLRAIERGEAAFTRKATLQVVQEFHRLGNSEVDHAEELPPLTDRETEVLSYLKKEFSNSEIAKTLVISVNTVKVHVHNIMKKFNVSNRREVRDIAHRYNL